MFHFCNVDGQLLEGRIPGFAGGFPHINLPASDPSETPISIRPVGDRCDFTLSSCWRRKDGNIDQQQICGCHHFIPQV